MDVEYRKARVIAIGEYSYQLSMYYDCESQAPWHNQELLGAVSVWTARPKAPGEKVLNSENLEKRYYDYQKAVNQCKADGLTNEEASKAADCEFQYLKDWCDDKWHYLLLEAKNLATGEQSSIGLIESQTENCRINELFRDLLYDLIGFVSDCPHNVWDDAKEAV
jgi:hypothetical protein